MFWINEFLWDLSLRWVADNPTGYNIYQTLDSQQTCNFSTLKESYGQNDKCIFIFNDIYMIILKSFNLVNTSLCENIYSEMIIRKIIVYLYNSV